MINIKNSKENLYEYQNLTQGNKSWDDFMKSEIEESQDNLGVDREEDF